MLQKASKNMGTRTTISGGSHGENDISNVTPQWRPRLAVIEMGAGSAIPTIRATSEGIGYNLPGATVLRITPREPEIKTPHISMPCGALEGLQKINDLL